jgi:GTP-binding protein EngB required for normal cell division
MTAVAGEAAEIAATPDPDETGLAGPSGLSARLTALARLIQIGAARVGGEGFSADLLADAEALLARAGERLRLSSRHTVVALAGGTGSGKSSLFNRIAGADFSAIGVTRPVTRDAHACVWGAQGAGPLLEWLGVPRRLRYERESALGAGERSLDGLVLLDLPDHDSVVAGASDRTSRLTGLADLVVWVLDPQKYADAAVHRRYLAQLAGHADVVAVVLNQSDLLSPAEVEECSTDLRRLLDAEGLCDAPILATSALTGAGLAKLRNLLSDTVSARQAAAARISAEVEVLAARFAPYAAEPVPAAADRGAAVAAGKPPWELDDGPGPPGDRAGAAGTAADPAEAAEDQDAPRHGLRAGALADPLTEAFARAAGVAAAGDALASARELRAVDYTGWPVAWLAARLAGRDPIRRIRLGRLWDELRGLTSGPSPAQRADIDQALTQVADQVAATVPPAWQPACKAAVRSGASGIPDALSEAMTQSMPPENLISPWWRLAGTWQGLLLGSAVVGLAWIAAILVFGVGHTAARVPRLFAATSLIGWLVVVIAAFLLLGWLSAVASLNLVSLAAARERARFEAEIRSRIAAIARDLVIVPVEQELSELQRFRDELRVAAGR